MSATQRAGTKLVDISYDVSSTETNMVTISLIVSNGAEAVSSTSLSGDTGTGVSTGTGKSLVWDAGTDWNTNVAAGMTVIIIAEDGKEEPPPCPLAKTGQTISYRTGDDGDLEIGAAWPTPRFTDNGDDTVTDNLTGLEWVKTPHSLIGNDSSLLWNDGIDFCNSLEHAGHSDWRLPTCREALSLTDFGQHEPALASNAPFSGIHFNSIDLYMTSTTLATATNTVKAFFVYDGHLQVGGYRMYVWPMRNPGGTAPIPIPQTGQSTSYRTGDDGDLKPGTAWPDPRFTDNGDGTATDHLTGLQWIKAPHGVSGNNRTNWNGAMDFCEALTYAENSDWRMPNIKELETLVNCGQGAWGDEPVEWLNSSETPFSGIQSGNFVYFSSTTHPFSSGAAWCVRFRDGSIWTGSNKAYNYFTWPVRGGL